MAIMSSSTSPTSLPNNVRITCSIVDKDVIACANVFVGVENSSS